MLHAAIRSDVPRNTNNAQFKKPQKNKLRDKCANADKKYVKLSLQ